MTYEESRIETPALPGGVQVPYALVEAGGFTAYAGNLRKALCSAPTVAAAERQLRRQGARLWRTAVARAQGRVVMGTIERYDDRPLYWTRLMGTRDIRQWSPRFAVSDEQRADLLRVYEYAARGITSAGFRPGVTRVLVSGFDPYQLNDEIRRSNPSGGAALQLDGLTFRAGGRRVQVQAVAFLSNESMYRSNRLRLELGATDVPGGHLHVSALVYPADPLVLLDAAFSADRAATIAQTVALVKAAGAAV